MIADFYFKKRRFYKTASIAFFEALELCVNTTIIAPLHGRLAECARHTEFGPIFTEPELVEWREAALELPDLHEFARINRWTVPDMSFLSIDPRKSLVVPRPGTREHYRLPRFFRWIVPNVLASFSQPRNADDIAVFDSAPFLFDVVVKLCE